MRSTVCHRALATAGLAVCVQAHATYTATATANVQVRGQSYVPAVDHTPQSLGQADSHLDVKHSGTAHTSAGAGIHVLAGAIDATGGGSSWAIASPGGVHAAALSNGATSLIGATSYLQLEGRGIAGATALVTDLVTFSVASLPAGAALRMNISVGITGGMDWNGQRVAGIAGDQTLTKLKWELYVGGNWVDDRGGEVYTTNGVINYDTRSATGVRSYDLQVANGVPGLLSMKLEVGASAQANMTCADCGGLFAEAVAASDYGHTFAWNGVQSITDGAGNPLALGALQVNADSGFDYRVAYAAPVPEGSTSTLLLAGAGVLGMLVRRRGWPAR